MGRLKRILLAAAVVLGVAAAASAQVDVVLTTGTQNIHGSKTILDNLNISGTEVVKASATFALNGSTVSPVVPAGSAVIGMDSVSSAPYVSTANGVAAYFVACSTMLANGDLNRSLGTVYQNTTGHTIQVAVSVSYSSGNNLAIACNVGATSAVPMEVMEQQLAANAGGLSVWCPVLPSQYYKVSVIAAGGSLRDWVECR